MAGENCVITDSTAPDGDQNRWVHATAYEHGVTFQADSSENRNHQVLYPKSQKSAAFSLTIIFSSHARYEDFSNWVVRYARRISDPDNIPVAMQVWIPARSFVRSGVPQGVTFGDEVKQTTWGLMLDFVGVQDPLSYSSPLLSRFKKIGEDSNRGPLLDGAGIDVGQYFYPAGIQLSEDDRLAADAAKRAEQAAYANDLPKRKISGPQ